MRGATPLILPRLAERFGWSVGSLGFGERAGLGGAGFRLVVSLESLDLLDELADVLELAVDRGKPDVGDRIEPLQVVHDHSAELLAADLLLGALVQLGLDLDDNVVDRLHADRPLLARLQDGAAELLAVEGLAAAVALDHVRQHILDVLVGRIPTVALEALAAAPDELPVPAHPRVDDPILRVTAKRALHRAPPFPDAGWVIGFAQSKAGTDSSAPGPVPVPSPPPTRSRGSPARGRSGERSRPSRPRACRASPSGSSSRTVRCSC